jgi:hypothetical protein
MLRIKFTIAGVLGVLMLLSGVALAADSGAKPGVVCHVKVLSDKVDDVSSLEAWKASFIKDGMSDQEKAIAIWKTVASFQYQDGTSPQEFLTHEDNVYDPIKMFNVYGYGICCYASAHVEGLGRYLGLKGRGWGINCHSVCELNYDNSWHLFDSSLIGYFPKADGKVASVEEISNGILDWYKANPAFYDGKHGIDAKLREFQRGDGDTAWKTKGPEILSRCTTYDSRGWWPAGTHGWYSTMQEYDGTGGGANGKFFIYDYGALLGYEVNIELRPGEKLTRNWFNKGLHVQMDVSPDNPPSSLNQQTGKGFQKHTPQFGDLAPGRIGNGTFEYHVPLASAEFRSGALTVENLASKAEDKAEPAVHLQDAAKPGVLIIRMPSSYVYLSGKVNLKAVVGTGGEIGVEFSDNNGLDWKEVKKISASGSEELDIKSNVYRRYDYRLKFTLKGKGTGLDELNITHDIQHSQRPLPALTQGYNKITFSAGAQESTITVAANTRTDHAGKQVQWTDFHGVFNNFDKNIGKLTAPTGEATIPVSTPGDMTRLRFAMHYQSWSPGDSWEFQVSFDGGKTFTKIGDGEGTIGGTCKYYVVSDVPPGTRSAQVRYIGTLKSANLLWAFRIDADYKEANAGFRPVKVTYLWEEDGKPKQDIHTAKSPTETYTINCATKPLMKSIVLELAE